MRTVRYNYGFVRRDLTDVQQIIQWGHALQGATLSDARLEEELDPLHTVLFEVANERELLDVAKELERENIAFYKFYEPDYDLGYTALCTYSVSGAEREFFLRYRKFGSPTDGTDKALSTPVAVKVA